jgi:hypothetical protein
MHFEPSAKFYYTDDPCNCGDKIIKGDDSFMDALLADAAGPAQPKVVDLTHEILLLEDKEFELLEHILALTKQLDEVQRGKKFYMEAKEAIENLGITGLVQP